MHRIIRWFSNHRKNIKKTILTLVILIAVVQFFRWVSIKMQKDKQESIIIDNTQTDYSSIILNENKSTVTGQKLSETQTKYVEVIDNFIEFCNNKQINEAYNLLTEECKSEMYPNINEFQDKYYSKIFNVSTRNISVENWTGNIYKVKFMEDILATGNYNTGDVLQDYITVNKDQNGKFKLNINNYIRKEKMNREVEKNDIKIKVLEKNKYMDYETYVFEVTNKTGSKIMLNDLTNPQSMYLEDRNGIMYNAYTHELTKAELRLLPGETKNVTIKYFNKYSSDKRIEKITFSNIILNYDLYSSNIDSKYYDYGTIEINL